MGKRRKKKNPKDPWYWVDGLTRNSLGQRIWFPLYCSKNPFQAKTLLKMVLNAERFAPANPKEFQFLSEFDFEDFRIREPGQKIKAPKPRPRCPKCGNASEPVKRGAQRLWRCTSCGKRWPRADPSKAPVRPSEASEAPEKGLRPRKRPAKRS